MSTVSGVDFIRKNKPLLVKKELYPLYTWPKIKRWLGLFHTEISGIIWAPTYDWWLWAHQIFKVSSLLFLPSLRLDPSVMHEVVLQILLVVYPSGILIQNEVSYG